MRTSTIQINPDVYQFNSFDSIESFIDERYTDTELQYRIWSSGDQIEAYEATVKTQFQSELPSSFVKIFHECHYAIFLIDSDLSDISLNDYYDLIADFMCFK